MLLRALIAFAVVVSLGLPAAPSKALTFGISSDADFLANYQPDFTKLFGGNVRWGNGANNGDWEYSIVDGNDIPIPTPEQYAWVAGANPHDVLFAFDSVTPSADLTISLDPTTSSGVVDLQGLSVNALFIRGRANGGDAANLSAIEVVFDVGGSVNLADLVGDVDAEYIVLVDSRLADGFTVTANALIQDGSGSLPQYGFKVGALVPEPGTALLMALGLGLLSAKGRRSPRRAAW